jgi:DNA invertase Pin-like site-specific DNA recombinase|tara:strand:- start:202 stop:801 length:600 start_codon:yes stop_codon:yes gene_type:complete
MEKNMKVGIYVRVSTLQQTTDNQLLELYEICERNDWTVVEEYNETVSGTKGVDSRSELNRLLKDASRKKFSKVVIWSVDRLGRSMKHLVMVLSQLKDLDVDIYSYKQGIDTSTTMGSSFFHMVGIFAELENNMRSERQKIGIKRAMKDGIKFGRKDVMDEEKEYQIYNLRSKGKSIRAIAKEVGISVGRTHKACSSMSL